MKHSFIFVLFLPGSVLFGEKLWAFAVLKIWKATNKSIADRWIEKLSLQKMTRTSIFLIDATGLKNEVTS